MRRILLLLTAAAVTATMLALAGPSFAAPDDTDPTVDEQLKQVRQATAKYQTPKQAEAAGYEAPAGCVPRMGYHYVNRDDVLLTGTRDDLSPGVEGEYQKPEALLYAPDETGELQLVAVEWIVPDADQNLSTDSDRPQLFGRPFDGPMLPTRNG